MEFGGEPHHPAHTTMTYSGDAKTNKVVVTSWAEKEGAVVQRCIPIDMPAERSRPSNYGVIKAKFNGAYITQYVSRTV